MGTSLTLEENIYIPIIELFKNKDVDYEKIGKLIINACNLLECQSNVDIDERVIIRNALLLILGLIYKDEPIENLGKDIHALSSNEVNRIIEDIRAVFNKS
ncbi:MAG: hypothetical protein ACTSRA_12030 [Promethearchaeota archaeon]